MSAISGQTWLTDEVRDAVRRRAAPWTKVGCPVVEYMVGTFAGHHHGIQKLLAESPEGTIVVAALPPGTAAVGPFDGCWTYLHEFVVREQGPSCLVVRKGYPTRRTYRIYIPAVTQVGDIFSMFGLFKLLRRRWHDVSFHFDGDVTRIMPDAIAVNEKAAKETPWDGVLNHHPDWSEISKQFRWKTNFYRYPLDLAIRMGWLPQGEKTPAVEPYPYSPADLAWAREHVPYERGTYVVIVPRSGWWPRDWPADRTTRLAQFLDMNGVPVVLVGNTGDKPEVEGYEFRRTTDLIGKSNVAQCAAIMAGARLVITPDTGLMHVAASFGVEILGIWGPSNHALTAPANVEPVFRSDGGCTQCYGRMTPHSGCGYTSECMQVITTTQVIERVAAKLGISAQREPTVSLCMMVKNEMKMLPGALESARDLADEMVIVDTGSKDGTREWIANHPWARAFDFDVGPEIQSFSEVRNFAFSKATSKYVIWLDACERLNDAAGLKALVEREKYDCYALPVAHGGLRYTREKIVPRMFAHFVDRVHEFLPCHGLRDGTAPPELGITRLTYKKVGRESCESRNVRLLKMQLEEAPRHPRRSRWLFYLGRDLCDAKRYDEAIPCLSERVMLVGFGEERFAAGVLLGRILTYEKKNYARAARVAENLVALRKDLREGHYLAGEAFYWNRKYADALSHYERCLALPRPAAATMWLWEDVYTWLPYDRLSRVYEVLSNTQEAIRAAEAELELAPPSESGWIVERIKNLSGVPTMLEAVLP